MAPAKTFLAAVLLLCCYLRSAPALETEKGENAGTFRKDQLTAGQVQRGHAAQNGRQNKTLVLSTKVNTKTKKKTTTGGSGRARTEPRGGATCTSRRGICQDGRYACQGHHRRGRCSVARTPRCCVPAEPWSALCAGYHNNRIRACDAYGCGAYNSRRGAGLHEAVDVVCDDFAEVSAPFSGTLAGPVGRAGPEGIRYDGVKLLSDVYCVKMFNIRPHRYMGAITKGEVLGYVLPLQDRFSGITPHMELQMCDRSDPSPFI